MSRKLTIAFNVRMISTIEEGDSDFEKALELAETGNFDAFDDILIGREKEPAEDYRIVRTDIHTTVYLDEEDPEANVGTVIYDEATNLENLQAPWKVTALGKVIAAQQLLSYADEADWEGPLSGVRAILNERYPDAALPFELAVKDVDLADRIIALAMPHGRMPTLEYGKVF